MKSSVEMQKKRQTLVFPREVLLIEIERHCADAACNARTRIGLTKEEARLYDGFVCEVCERRHEDGLTERDIPDWWEELNVTGLATLRGTSSGGGDESSRASDEEGGGVVARLSEAWQSRARRSGQLEGRGAKDAPGDGGDESL
ncbi:MAG: hypothetical protein QOD32_1891 [Pyrinomonadaceae bacterium]|nr:hypothetical protein [Pyrinomonadaceae bacterium]